MAHTMSLSDSTYRHKASETEVSLVNDVNIFSIKSLKGEVEHELKGVHSFAISPNLQTTTPASENGGRFNDIEWGPNRFTYLPPGVKLKAVSLVEADTVYFVLPDRIFGPAAFETVNVEKLERKWVYNVDDPVALDLMNAASKVAKDDGAKNWPLLVESIGTALSVRAMQAMGAQPLRGDVPYPSGLSSERLRRVVDYVEANLHRAILLTELAEIAALSPFHFSRAFRKAIGRTPVRYVWSRRVERSKRLLRDRVLPLAAIAYDCGFSSQSHFTTVFKRETGVTPLRYRAGL
jgi:AraC family transcriptional regulator